MQNEVFFKTAKFPSGLLLIGYINSSGYVLADIDQEDWDLLSVNEANAVRNCERFLTSGRSPDDPYISRMLEVK